MRFFAVVILVFVVGTAAAQSATKVEARLTAENIRTYLSRLEGFGFSGAVLVAKDGKIIVESPHGLADRDKKIAVRADTIFDVGSVTKQFTAAAILVLESDGKLRVEDPISKYFAKVPLDKFDITVHHLLTHTSGLEIGFGDDYEKVSRDEIVRHAMESKLLSVPGERHAYSNAGYSLLAAIVEIASGKSYETFLRERLFQPAGMNSSGHFFSKETAYRLAKGYKSGEEWGIGAVKADATGGHFWNLIGNGGVHSTVGDMNRWMAALEEGKVLTKEAREKLFKPHVVVTANYRRSNSPLHCAYGWYVWKQPSGKTLIFHLGGNGVFNFAVRYHADDHAFVIYGSNVSEFHDPSYPVPAIEKILAGETVEMPPKVVSLPASQITNYSGRYRDATGALLELEPRHGFVDMRGEGQAALSLVAGGEWLSDEKLAKLNERTAKIAENSRAGKFESVLAEYRAGTSLNDVTELETVFWKKRHDRHGSYKGMRVLGTLLSRSRAYMAATIVAFEFERATIFREYLWTPNEKIGDLGPITAPPIARYFPISAKCFARFDPAEAVVVSTVCFAKGGILEVVQKGDGQIKLKKL